jgi:hypothetical protein
MARQCEICGGIEANEDESAEESQAIEFLFVCDVCRKERQL